MKKPFYQEDIVEICDNKHLTVDEIFSLLKKKHPSVGRATVYRNVEDLVKLGYLKKLTSIWPKAVFEKNKWFHMHIYEEEKWELIDLDVDLDKVNIPLPEGFKISDVDIVIKGRYTN